MLHVQYISIDDLLITIYYIEEEKKKKKTYPLSGRAGASSCWGKLSLRC